jgi:hypothetical protein
LRSARNGHDPGREAVGEVAMQLMQIEPDLLQGVADAADYAAE